MKKALVIANMIFASATVWGMENPAQIAQERSPQNQMLETALLEKNIEHVAQAIDEGAEINVIMSNNRTPLTFAIDESDVDLSSILVGLGADVNLKDNENSTPLTLSMRKECDSIYSQSEDSGQKEITDMLLQSENINLELSGEWEMSPLAIAMEMDSARIDLKGADKSQIDMTKKLLQAGAKANDAERLSKVGAIANGIQGDSNLDTHLMRAVMYHNEFMIRLLLDNGADINAKNRYGDTAVSLAARWGYVDILEFLYIPKQDEIVRLLNAWKSRIPYASSSNNQLTLVNRRLDNINERNNNGYTALMGALEAKQLEASKWLINHGVNVNLQNNSGRTALMFAARNGYSEIVQDLLNKGARTDLTDNENHSARWFAEENGHNEVVEILNNAN